MRSHVVKRVSPILTVADMDETLEFYTEVLDFNIAARSTEYSIAERDGATVIFVKADDESVLEAVRGHVEIYVEVDDIDSFWQHIQRYKDRYKIRGLFDQPYGMTEFHIVDPNECLVFVGRRQSEESIKVE